ncbi:hypothetical protein GE09DRAFT_132807 [Coniochaeta sp. 2T2.1]|nr:hypothetical protein GE09DRAFT_132807 [Coniochaeta sp. 2T2.1]
MAAKKLLAAAVACCSLEPGAYLPSTALICCSRMQSLSESSDATVKRVRECSEVFPGVVTLRSGHGPEAEGDGQDSPACVCSAEIRAQGPQSGLTSRVGRGIGQLNLVDQVCTASSVDHLPRILEIAAKGRRFTDFSHTARNCNHLHQPACFDERDKCKDCHQGAGYVDVQTLLRVVHHWPWRRRGCLRRRVRRADGAKLRRRRRVAAAAAAVRLWRRRRVDARTRCRQLCQHNPRETPSRLVLDLDALPRGPTAEQREASPYHAAFPVTAAHGSVRRGVIHTVDGYIFTAMASVVAARRVLGGEARLGFQTPA